MRSVCPYDCPDACGLLVHVEEGKAIKVSGDNEHPFTRGTLCPKMAKYEKTVHSTQRIVTPLIRSGPKGSGSYKPISWEQAIEQITLKWTEIIEKYGAEAILPFSYAGTMGLVQRNAGHPFFYSLGASRLERTICAPAKGYGWQAVMGETLAPHPSEIQKSDLVILWGLHALATNIHIMHDVDYAKKRGAKVWLIDTYKTSTAKAADEVFVVKPGTDGALALGMMHVIDRDNLIDNDFINSSVQGFEDFKNEILPQYTPEAVCEITGLSAEVIEEMARAYAKAKAPFIRLGSGLSRYGNGAMTVRTITCLPALVGAWKKPGGGLMASVSTGSALDAAFVTREDFQENITRNINMNQLGSALNELANPPVMSLYVYASNPAAVVPDQNKVIAGLERDDLFTIVHERFMTDTAKYADIILPATTSLEHSDIYRSYGHYAVQRAYPVIPAVGESKSNWEVFCLLANAMGIKNDFFNMSADDLIEAALSEPSTWLAQTNLDELRQGLPVELPLAHDYKTSFKTPSGKIEILNPREEERLPYFKLPYGDEEKYWLVNSPDPRLLNSSFNERIDLIKKDKMLLKMNPADAAQEGFKSGDFITAYNNRGEVDFELKITNDVPPGIVVTEGVWWIEHAPGKRAVNALTSQRLTDKAKGSTFYDVKVSVRLASNNIALQKL
ncbi:molybdopterin-dependent oxidoreductase [Dendrosporobacter sp. 1207_IL3150]|uniref:molybdopterin-dependent oxidoreductase n=1 Tax=Dendrosporobacter sp. 1207_IL3150 TaxID=3084054 RepID=UPI002FD8C151